MSEPQTPRTPPASTPGLDPQPGTQPAAPVFTGSSRSEGSGLPPAVWGVAALIVAAIVAALLLTGRKRSAAPPTTLQPADPYAQSLPLSGLQMSEASSLSGGKLTYLDGHIRNTGPRTVIAVTAQVVFGNDEALPPAIDTVPLSLIRTRQPYIDTEPVSADPIKPGDDREFRLIFESVPDNWNTQMPQVRLISITTR